MLNDGRVWLRFPVLVVRDDPGLLATYVPEGTPFEFPEGSWPTSNGRHPWHGRERWKGHGLLMLQRPGEAHAIWLFWHGPEREFRGWYVNLQEPFRRKPPGYATQHLELEIWVPLDRRGSGRTTSSSTPGPGRALHRRAGVEIRAEGARIAADLDAGRRWWSDDWASWTPDHAW